MSSGFESVSLVLCVFIIAIAAVLFCWLRDRRYIKVQATLDKMASSLKDTQAECNRLQLKIGSMR